MLEDMKRGDDIKPVRSRPGVRSRCSFEKLQVLRSEVTVNRDVHLNASPGNIRQEGQSSTRITPKIDDPLARFDATGDLVELPPRGFLVGTCCELLIELMFTRHERFEEQ